MTGRAGLVLFAAWGVVLAYPSAATATPDKPKIVIMKPEVRGAITEGVGYNVFIQLETAIRDMFPCASVLTMDDAATIISVAKDRRTLGSGEAAEDTLKAVGKQMDADLVISISMRTRGTTHNDPGRNLSTTVLDARRSEALEKTSAEGEGWDWSSKDLIKETIDRLRGTADDFCPWQGTVVYQRRVQVDTQKSGTTEESNGGLLAGVEPGSSTTTVKNIVKDHQNAEWTFELKRGRLDDGILMPDSRVKTSGGESYDAATITESKSSNVSCFPRGADGVVRDDKHLTHASQATIERETSKGNSGEMLVPPKITLVRQAETSTINGVVVKKPSWSIAVEAMPGGKGETNKEVEHQGDCAGYTEKEPRPDFITPEMMFTGRAIMFSVEAMEDEDELQGTKMLTNTAETKESVSWKLTRK
jgi:hypothetical protein